MYDVVIVIVNNNNDTRIISIDETKMYVCSQMSRKHLIIMEVKYTIKVELSLAHTLHALCQLFTHILLGEHA